MQINANFNCVFGQSFLHNRSNEFSDFAHIVNYNSNSSVTVAEHDSKAIVFGH